VVTVAEIKNSLRINASVTNDDTLLAEYVATATRLIENKLGLVMIDQTFRVSWDTLPRTQIIDALAGHSSSLGFSDYHLGSNPLTIFYAITDNMNLGLYPVTAVDKFAYYDDENNENIWASSNYVLDAESRPSRVSKLPNGSWFTGPFLKSSAVRVEVTAGFGAASTDVPPELKMAVLRFAEYLYENRGCDLSIPASVWGMVSDWRVYRL